MTDETRTTETFDDAPLDADPGEGAAIEGPDSEPATDETAPKNDEVVEP